MIIVLILLPLGCVVGYGFLVVLAHLISRGMIFPAPPSSYQADANHFFITASDGTRLAARYWENPDARHTVLWFHGNGEDLGTIADYLPEWQRRGFAILAIDYRGYGRSEGTPSETSTYADAFSAFAWLQAEKHLLPGQVIVMGYSLGSGPAVEVATREPVAGLILLAPFVSAYRTLTRAPLVLGDKFENLKKIGRLQCPLLVIHGEADQTVAFWHGRRLLDAARVRKQHLWVAGADHGNVAETAGEAYFDAIRKFADSL